MRAFKFFVIGILVGSVLTLSSWALESLRQKQASVEMPSASVPAQSSNS